MALTRDEARLREKAQLRRYLTCYEDDGMQLSSGDIALAMQVFENMPQASPENVLWAAIRHAAGDPGTLQAKVAVRAQRNGPLNVDWRRLRRMFDRIVPAGLTHTLVVEQCQTEVAEAIGIVAKPDAFEQRVRADYAG